MRIATVIQVIGRVLRLFGVVFVIPLGCALVYGEQWEAGGFVTAGALAIGAGQLMRRAAPQIDDDIRRLEGLATVAGTWLSVAAVGAVPYLWVGLSPINALFESMSGFTTTGATILVDFDELGRGMLLWRSLTQWLGGMGVITLVVAVLPRFGLGVRHLFFAETPGPTDEKLTPQIRKTAALLWRLYVGLTAAEVIALLAAGMPAFDSVCHAMTTLAAGGFSPHPRSIMGYDNAAVEWIICVFMFLAGANFALQYRALAGDPGLLYRDDEFRAYGGIVLVVTVVLASLLWRAGTAATTAVRHAAFQVLSILTTTGYASTDFNLWSDQARMVLLLLMFVGGCAGSAAGGPKVARHVLLARYTLLELRRALHPRGVLPVKLGGKVVSEEVMRTVLVFFLFYLLAFAVCVSLVVGFGADLITGLTATMATLGNVGPGLNVVGPMASYAPLPPLSKLTLVGAMWVGRLEVLTVLVVLRPEVWRTARWGSDRLNAER